VQLSKFRAIFEGLIIADLVAKTRIWEPADHDIRWQSLLAEVGLSCITGQVPNGATHGMKFRQVWASSPAGGLIGALPVLLLNLEPYGHRRAYVAQWAEETGLSQGAIAALDDFFVYLCRIHRLCASTRQPLPGQKWNLQAIPSMTTPSLVVVQDLVQQVQGQFLLGLQVAQRQELESAQVGLVALITAFWGGLQSLPLQLRRECLMQTLAVGDRDRLTTDRIQIMQLGDELYRLWSGVSSAMIQEQSRLPFGVTVSI
jgi:hypothetical protein